MNTNKKKFKIKDFYNYWKRKYLYFFITCMLIWYFITPNNDYFYSIYILPLDIIYSVTFGGFSELNLFEFIFYNLIGAVGIYAVSVTVFIIVIGGIFNDNDPFENAALRWLIGIKDTSEPINYKIIWTKKEILKEKREESKMKFKQWMFNLSMIYVPIISLNVLNILRLAL